jgi:hypothetical protein
MKNEVAIVSIIIALVVGSLVGYYGTTLGKQGVSTTTTTTEMAAPNFIALASNVSLCSSNCIYPSPYLSGTVAVNASTSSLTSLRLVINGTDEGIVATFTNNTITNFDYELKANPNSSSMPIQAGKAYSILLIATFRDGGTSTALATTVAS